jgi:DNA-binding MarR family transcriptional regulator
VTQPPIPSAPEFLAQLRRTSRRVSSRLDSELAATGLTTPQYTVLGLLEQYVSLSSSDLARESLVTAQTMNVLVTALEGGGMVVRTRHPDHGRILLVTLTPAGRTALIRGLELAARVEAELLATLSAAERRRLIGYLRAVEQARPQELGTRS